MTVANPRGLELLVLSGDMQVERERLEAQSWLRLPAGGELVAEIGKDGAGVWIKDGPLLHPDVLVIPSAPLEVHYMP